MVRAPTIFESLSNHFNGLGAISELSPGATCGVLRS